MKTLGIALAIVMGLHGVVFAAAGQKSFESLDDAVNALIGAFRAADRKALVEILGPKGVPIVSSGDNVADRAAFQRFVAAYDRAHRLEGGGGKVVLYVGDDDYPLPIPLVPDGPTVVLGHGRRGRGAALSPDRAKRALHDPDVSGLRRRPARILFRDRGAGILEFAQRLESTKGKRDGLYWDTRPGERPSPLGPLVAEARAAGYTKPEPGKRMPYHGYLYRLLLAQGPDAPGGAYDLRRQGAHDRRVRAGRVSRRRTASSGIMTFIVSHDGVVYQKDLGPNTAQLANAMKTYNPDKTWTKVASDASAR